MSNPDKRMMIAPMISMGLVSIEVFHVTSHGHVHA